MKVIVPMSGLGSRFARAGYEKVKPLIDVQGRPVIEWVTKMFPDDCDFVFICRNDHLETTEMKEVLSKLKPNAKIVGIDGHKKGPVYAVTKALDYIEDDEQIVVTYCDYYMHWDFADFEKDVNNNNCDGAVPCYTGFHPNLIPKINLYAGCRVDSKMMLEEIKEKHSFEQDKSKGNHSPGVYYFKSGKIVKDYFQKMLDVDLNLNGEYYVSLVYKLMLEDNKDIFVYNKIPSFCQWGTPEDLEDYLFWTNAATGAQ